MRKTLTIAHLSLHCIKVHQFQFILIEKLPAHIYMHAAMSKSKFRVIWILVLQHIYSLNSWNHHPSAVIDSNLYNVRMV